MKRKLSLILSLLLLFSGIPVFAQGSGEAEIFVEGKYIGRGKVQGGRTLGDAKPLGEALGFEVLWKEEERTLELKGGDHQFLFIPGEPYATVDGKKTPLDTPAVLTGDRFLLPLRFLGESLGREVTWEGKYRIARIDKFQEKPFEKGESVFYSSYPGVSWKVPKDFFSGVHTLYVEDPQRGGLFFVYEPSAEALAKEFPDGFGGILYRVLSTETPFSGEKDFIEFELKDRFITAFDDSDMGFTEETSKDFWKKAESMRTLLGEISLTPPSYPKEAWEALTSFLPEELGKKGNLTILATSEKTELRQSEYVLEKVKPLLQEELRATFDKEGNLLEFSYLPKNREKTKAITKEEGRALGETLIKKVLKKEETLRNAEDLTPEIYGKEGYFCYQDSKGGIIVIDLERGFPVYYVKNPKEASFL